MRILLPVALAAFCCVSLVLGKASSTDAIIEEEAGFFLSRVLHPKFCPGADVEGDAVEALIPSTLRTFLVRQVAVTYAAAPARQGNNSATTPKLRRYTYPGSISSSSNPVFPFPEKLESLDDQMRFVQRSSSCFLRMLMEEAEVEYAELTSKRHSSTTSHNGGDDEDEESAFVRSEFDVLRRQLVRAALTHFITGIQLAVDSSPDHKQRALAVAESTYRALLREYHITEQLSEAKKLVGAWPDSTKIFGANNNKVFETVTAKLLLMSLLLPPPPPRQPDGPLTLTCDVKECLPWMLDSNTPLAADGNVGSLLWVDLRSAWFDLQRPPNGRFWLTFRSGVTCSSYERLCAPEATTSRLSKLFPAMHITSSPHEFSGVQEKRGQQALRYAGCPLMCNTKTLFQSTLRWTTVSIASTSPVPKGGFKVGSLSETAVLSSPKKLSASTVVDGIDVVSINHDRFLSLLAWTLSPSTVKPKMKGVVPNPLLAKHKKLLALVDKASYVFLDVERPGAKGYATTTWWTYLWHSSFQLRHKVLLLDRSDLYGKSYSRLVYGKVKSFLRDEVAARRELYL